MRRIRPGDLIGPGIVVGVLVYVLLRFSYDSIPPLGKGIAVPLFVLGVLELVAARRVNAVVRHDPDAKPMTAIAVARCVALGKASALVGAGLLGAALGLIARVAPQSRTVHVAGNDLWVGLSVAGAAALLIVAGLLLERSGIDPGGGAQGIRDRREAA